MPFFIAGLSSFTFGLGDFVGGFATKKTPSVTVVTSSHIVALAGVLAVAPFVSAVPGAPELWWGAGAGVAGAVGLAVFYHALATTRMGVVAPIAALVGMIVPVVFGVLSGERPEMLAWAGIVLGVPAGLLLSIDSRPEGRLQRRGALLGVVSGFMFGLFGILISRTGTDAGLWPLVSARTASLVFMALVATAMKKPLTPERRQWRIVSAAGLLDMTANALYLIAVREELLSLISVIMSFYPAATIVLARVVLGERMTKVQWVGIACAAVAVGLIAGA